MILKSKNGLKWLEFELLADIPALKHGVFLRRGGISQGDFSSLNLCGKVGDDLSNVYSNREKVKEALGMDRLILGEQHHGKEIREVGIATDAVPFCDGLATKDCNAALMVLHADCQAAIFYDPVGKAVANVHCGWRGNVQNIYAEAIGFMKKKYFSRPEDLLVCISPSLGPRAAEFVHFRAEFPRSFWPYQVKPYYFDLWEISRMQLKKAGVLPHHIQIAEICTYSHPEDYFSHRYSKKRGANGTVVGVVDSAGGQT